MPPFLLYLPIVVFLFPINQSSFNLFSATNLIPPNIAFEMFFKDKESDLEGGAGGYRNFQGGQISIRAKKKKNGPAQKNTRGETYIYSNLKANSYKNLHSFAFLYIWCKMLSSSQNTILKIVHPLIVSIGHFCIFLHICNSTR